MEDSTYHRPDRAGERRCIRQHQATTSAASSTSRPATWSRQDLTATVTASGEIKPKNYINLARTRSVPRPSLRSWLRKATMSAKDRWWLSCESVQAERRCGGAKSQHSDTALADSAASEAGLKSQAGRRRHRAGDLGSQQEPNWSAPKPIWTAPRSCIKKNFSPSRISTRRRPSTTRRWPRWAKRRPGWHQAKSQEAQARQQLDFGAEAHRAAAGEPGSLQRRPRASITSLRPSTAS